MAADLPENYEKHLDAFQFIRDVAVDWDDTRVIEAEPGDFLTIVRKAKGKDVWFIGAITDENGRTANIPLNFLTANKTYIATIYADAADAHWQRNPGSYKIEKFLVNSKSLIKIPLADGGAAAVSLTTATNSDLLEYPNYQ